MDRWRLESQASYSVGSDECETSNLSFVFPNLTDFPFKITSSHWRRVNEYRPLEFSDFQPTKANEMTNTTSWNDFSQQPSKLFEPWLFVWLGVAIIVHKIAYSLWFHPLRHIPGPWSTKICGWYEFYTNIWLDGQWCKTYPDLHKRYGMSQVKCLKKCSPQYLIF